MLKIKTSPELFERWKELAERAGKLGIDARQFASIVQNDMLVSEEDFVQWQKDFLEWRRQSKDAYVEWRKAGADLFNETRQYIASLNASAS